MPDIFAFGPGGFQRAAEGEQGGAPDTIAAASGDRAEPGTVPRAAGWSESRAFPEVGFYRQEDEMRSTATTSSCCGRSPRPPAGASNPAPEGGVRCRGAEHPHDHESVARPAGAGGAAEPGGADPAQVEGRGGGAAPETAGGSVMKRGIIGRPRHLSCRRPLTRSVASAAAPAIISCGRTGGARRNPRQAA